MCGTFTSILGQAAALMVVETVISPNMYASEFRLFIDFMLKGVATYWIYNWSKCTGTGSSSSYTHNPLAGMNAMKIIVGGIFGGVVLALIGMFLPMYNGYFGGMDFFGYVIQAIILNFSYNMGANIIADFA